LLHAIKGCKADSDWFLAACLRLSSSWLGAVGPDVYVNLISEFTMESHADGYLVSLHACYEKQSQAQGPTFYIQSLEAKMQNKDG
jgi:hypothetical protein